jgi:hypothetical protein
MAKAPLEFSFTRTTKNSMGAKGKEEGNAILRDGLVHRVPFEAKNTGRNGYPVRAKTIPPNVVPEINRKRKLSG